MSDNTIGSEGRVHNRLMVLEQREGVLKGASVDLWHRMQMECGGSELRAVLLGPVDGENPLGQLLGSGVIHHAGDERLREYDPRLYGAVIRSLFEGRGAVNCCLPIRLFPATLLQPFRFALGPRFSAVAAHFPGIVPAPGASIPVQRREIS